MARNVSSKSTGAPAGGHGGAFSLPFEVGEHKRAAAKIVDDRGIESSQVWVV